MENLDVNIIKYMGRVHDSVMTLINVTIPEENISFDAILIYNKDLKNLTVPEEIEIILESPIEETPLYELILKKCEKKLVPFEEIFDNIDPFDAKPYLEQIIKDNNIE